jgi:hypothetical protein
MMATINIAAALLSDDDALRIIREFADLGFDINATGPTDDASYGADPAAAQDPDCMAPTDRRAWYQSELMRQQINREMVGAPPRGWQINATRDEVGE